MNGFPPNSRPSLMMKHVDGPLLTFRDGQMHWLSLWESVRIRLGWDTAETLERKLRPDLFTIALLAGG